MFILPNIYFADYLFCRTLLYNNVEIVARAQCFPQSDNPTEDRISPFPASDRSRGKTPGSNVFIRFFLKFTIWGGEAYPSSESIWDVILHEVALHMLEKSYPGIWLFHCQAGRRTHKTVLNSISNRQYQQRKNLLVNQLEIRMLNRLVTRKKGEKVNRTKGPWHKDA